MSTALALPDPDDRAPIVIPPALAELGVTVAEANGVRVVQIPEGLKARVNIIQPVTQIAQADPDYTPRLSLVHLSVDQHTYKQEGKLALNKEALLLLGHASGIDIDTQMVPRTLLRDSEIAYKAIVTLRRSDGTLATWSGSKKIDLDDERAAIEEQVHAAARKAASEGQPWAENAIADRIRTRWVKEKPHLEAKCETKAVLRAVAAVLQLPRGGYQPSDFAKPFMTIGWGYSPADPEARRLRALGAATEAYGPRAAAPAPEPSARPALAPASDVVDEVPASAQPVDDDDLGEPGPAAPVAGEIPADVAAALETEITFGKQKGRTIAAVIDDPECAAWLPWLVSTNDERITARHGAVQAAARIVDEWRKAQS